MFRRLTLPMLLPLAIACAQVKASAEQSNKKWGDGVIVANNMCAKDRSTQHSNDAAGQRVHCALEEMLGSHIPKCVCRDEMRTSEDRAEAVQYLREAESARQLVKSN
jgi:hypothetical protein